MTIQEAQNRIRNVAERLKAEAPMIALRQAQTALTLIKDKSIREGIRVNGAFADYSTKPVYKSSFKSKALNSGGSAYASSGGKGNWGEFRSAQGRTSDNVNLFYSGRMWTAFRILSQTEIAGRYSVLVGATDNEAQILMLSHMKRYGNFLTLSPTHKTILEGDATYEVSLILKGLP